jgi:Phosphopantothenoylcysteine synthetase/decarboxylase
LNIIVTSGGTRERIDAVRSITNGATGRLGSLIAGEFSRRLPGSAHTVYYLCGAGSAVPAEGGNIRIIRIEGTDDLQSRLEALLTNEKIDAVIHSMAVSDYKVNSIATPESIAESISRRLNDRQELVSQQGMTSIVKEALLEQNISGENKISSELEHPVLVLRKTPKVIEMIKRLSPQTLLVGFKLLSGADEKLLIDTAYRLLIKNSCDFVLANDTGTIKDGNHEGFLIDAGANFVKLEGKEAIAAAIADSVLKKIAEGTK